MRKWLPSTWMCYRSRLFMSPDRFAGGCCKNRKDCEYQEGQFLSPESMKFAVDKVRESGDNQVMVTERGNDVRVSRSDRGLPGISIMQQACQCPVVVDVTHSLQQPNQASG